MRWLVFLALVTSSLSLAADKPRRTKRQIPARIEVRTPSRIEICGPLVRRKHADGRIQLFERRAFEPPPLATPPHLRAEHLDFKTQRLGD